MLKFSRKNTAFEKFVDGIIEFIPDLKLIPIDNQNIPPSGICLAASGNGNEHYPIRKIGILTDPERNMIARIIENKKKDEYQIFFIPENPYRLQYSILSKPNSGQYFIIDANEIATIPKASKINPITDELVISFVKEQFNLDLNNSEKNILTGTYGNRLEVNYDKKLKYLNCKLFPKSLSGENDLRKILLYSLNKEEKYIRLVPVVHNKANIPIPKKYEGKYVICLFH